MTTMRNKQVIERFVRDREDGNEGYGSVSSKSGALYSYGARIAEWDGDTLIVNDGWDGYSPTTSKHFKFLHDVVTETDTDYEATGSPQGKGTHSSRRW